MPGISINGIKSCRLSANGTEVHITFISRYSGDFEVSMPLACRDELLALLTSNAAARACGSTQDRGRAYAGASRQTHRVTSAGPRASRQARADFRECSQEVGGHG